MRTLVIAPRFPSINQPWIDTYLEQLLKNDIDLAVFSVNREGGPYHDKVDALNLLPRIVQLSLKKRDLVTSVIRCLVEFYNVREIWRRAVNLNPHIVDVVGGFSKICHFRSAQARIGLFNIVHSHAERHGYAFLHLAMLQNIPMVLTFHGLPPKGIAQLSERKRIILYDHCSKILVNTEFAKAQVCGLGCDPRRVQILPQGLPLPDFPFVSRPAPRAGEPIRLLTVGRYHRDKGQAYALLGLRRLLDRGVFASWKFVGVGPDRPRLERLVQRLGLADHVIFLEGLPTADLQKLYHECHLSVLPSVTSPGDHAETQGVVLQEAQASGCIPIASRIGGIPECVTHQKDALLVKEKSGRAIADAVQYLLERPHEWAAYQQAGRCNVEENYSADVIGERMAELLRDVVANWQGYEGLSKSDSERTA